MERKDEVEKKNVVRKQTEPLTVQEPRVRTVTATLHSVACRVAIKDKSHSDPP